MVSLGGERGWGRGTRREEGVGGGEEREGRGERALFSRSLTRRGKGCAVLPCLFSVMPLHKQGHLVVGDGERLQNMQSITDDLRIG